MGYPPYQESSTGLGFNSASKQMPSEEDRIIITELFNKKQALMTELQHYEANAATSSLETVDRPRSAMPTNTRLQVGVAALSEEVFMILHLVNGVTKVSNI